ncbi:hypothetical protein PUMCH_000657 [Australozyma saopauloensis]|uniref:UDP-N-acetylglucosamine transferase subunit ALG13 n=1 Tax=Australozyma saopauloensis TaxID=291208 RepID=A0AAX4H4C8_9ASCO|nr:hypothetical protein PUMCH_000657 [[Candida] saopauloensis]
MDERKTILFLTGATVTFKPLLNHVVTPKFLRFLKVEGFSRIIIQYGNEKDAEGNSTSKHYFSQLLAEHNVMETLDLDVLNETNDKSITTLGNLSLKIEAFGFSDDINGHIRRADLVVSHGGTGSIMDALRLKKPLLVVTNDLLMEDHQKEIAGQLEHEGHLRALSNRQLPGGTLEELIKLFVQGKLKFTELPEPPKGVLQEIVNELTA